MARKIVLFLMLYFIMIAVVLAVGIPFLTTVDKSDLSSEKINQYIGIGVVAFIFVLTVPIIIFMIWITRPPAWQKDVLANGTAAVATLLSFQDTGVRVNRNFYMRLNLRVQPQNDEQFDAFVEKPYNYFQMPLPGRQLIVKYDPNNKKHLTVIDNPDPSQYGYLMQGMTAPAAQPYGAPMNASEVIQFVDDALHIAGTQGATVISGGTAHQVDGNIAGQLIQLATMHKNGELTDSEYEAAKKKVLG